MINITTSNIPINFLHNPHHHPDLYPGTRIMRRVEQLLSTLLCHHQSLSILPTREWAPITIHCSPDHHPPLFPSLGTQPGFWKRRNYQLHQNMYHWSTRIFASRKGCNILHANWLFSLFVDVWFWLSDHLGFGCHKQTFLTSCFGQKMVFGYNLSSLPSKSWEWNL